jgi:hypothetical protein
MDQPASPTPSPVSLGTRIINVFAAPAEAFEGIPSLPSKTSLWLVPLLVAVVLGIASALLIFSDEALRQQVVDAQIAALEQRVADGRMTQEQLDQAADQISAAGSMMMIFGAIAAAIIVPIYFVVAALALWLVGKLVLKSPSGYSTYLAAYGLSGWISIVGSLVTLLLIVGMGSLYASPSLGLAVLSEYNPKDFLHVLLSKVDAFGLWQAAVIGIGLSKISSKSVGLGIGTAAALWVLWVVLQLGWFLVTA